MGRVAIEDVPGVHSGEAIARKLTGFPGFFWLDSGDGKADEGRFPFARYSFFGCCPYRRVKVVGGRMELFDSSGQMVERWEGDPFLALQQVCPWLRPIWNGTTDGLPFPFCGGAVGYLGYGLRRFVEKVPARTSDDLRLPDGWFGLYDSAVVFDHAAERAFVLCPDLGDGKSLSGRPVQEVMGEWRSRWRMAWNGSTAADGITGKFRLGRSAGLQPSMDRARYVRAVRRVLDDIEGGHLLQANLSQRFCAEVDEPAFSLYLRLRRINPAPFGAYLDCGGFQILSASPERFLRISGDEVETRPIKGTRPRGRSPAEDAALRRELLASAKDRAEHVMIVDVERNDLGRVCRPGTVQVQALAALETHPTVFHLVSTIVGRVRPEVPPFEVIRAAFPGGSITGAPKVRAMEVIDELEPVARGVYTGALGYLGVGGEIDLNVVIRTLVRRGPVIAFHVGGGIVADSDPEAEYQETLVKGAALVAALRGDTGEEGSSWAPA